jgi:hypothetical protein
MLDGRKIQFFCATEDKDPSLTPTYELTNSATTHWVTFAEGCKKNADCVTKNGVADQRCTDFIWLGMDDGDSYGVGTACYNGNSDKCPGGPTISEKNENFATNKFSYYTQQWCADNFAITLASASAATIGAFMTLF